MGRPDGTGKAMTEQELARIRLRHGRAFSQRQFALLRRCAEKGDLSA
jgi:hypothetical protein